jgi:hypothetical protein
MQIKVLGSISRDSDGCWRAQFEYGVHELDAAYDPNATEPQAIRPRMPREEPAVTPWTIPAADSDTPNKSVPRGMSFPWAETPEEIRKINEKFEHQSKPENKNNVWAYKGYSVLLSTGNRFNRKINVTDDTILEIKYAVVQYEKRLGKLKRSVSAHVDSHDPAQPQRERISDQVRMFVWQRDEGKCVQCGRRDKLEFDHVIPVSRGGSNTERNIQLLCETCNRSKGASI